MTSYAPGEDRLRNVQVFEGLAIENADQIAAHVKLSGKLCQQGCMQESIVELRKAIDLGLRVSPVVYFDIGEQLMRDGHFEEAMEYFRMPESQDIPRKTTIYSSEPHVLRASLAPSTALPARVMRGEQAVFKFLIKNVGDTTWLSNGNLGKGFVTVGVKVLCGGKETEGPRAFLPYDVAPGERVEIELSLDLPGEGEYRLRFDMVAEHVCWFEQAGSMPFEHSIQVVNSRVDESMKQELLHFLRGKQLISAGNIAGGREIYDALLKDTRSSNIVRGYVYEQQAIHQFEGGRVDDAFQDMYYAIHCFPENARFYETLDRIKNGLGINPEQNRALNAWEAEHGRSVLKSRPFDIGIDLIGKCNFRTPCVWCYAYHDRNHDGLNMEELKKLGQFFQTSQQLVNCGIGEPFLLPDIDQVLDALHCENKQLIIGTNGVLLTEKNARIVIEKKLYHLNISLDAATPETYARVKGPYFEHVIENIRRICRIKRELGVELPIVSMSLLLCKETEKDLETFFKLGKELGVNFVRVDSLNPIAHRHVSDNGRMRFDYAEQLLDSKTIRDHLNQAEIYSKLYGLEVQTLLKKTTLDDIAAKTQSDQNLSEGAPSQQPAPSEEAHTDEVVEESQKDLSANMAECIEPWTFMVAYQNGDALGCCHMLKPLGDWRAEGLEALYNGPRMQQLRRELYANGVASECRSSILCPYGKRDLLKRKDGDAPIRRKPTIMDEISNQQPIMRQKLDSNRELNCHERSSGLLELKSLPLYVDLESTRKCNLNCIMCCAAHERREGLYRDSDLDPKVFAKVLEIAPTLECLSLSANGEPLMNHDLPDYIEALRRANLELEIKMTSNMTLMREAVAERLICAGFDALGISMDGSCRETFETIRAGANFQKVIRNIRRLNDLKLAYGTQLPRLHFSVVGLYQNVKELPEIVELAGSLGVLSMGYPYAIIHFHELEQHSLFHHQELFERMARHAQERARRFNVHFTHAPLVNGREYHNHAAQPDVPFKPLSFCLPTENASAVCPGMDPWYRLFIEYDGRVTPCCQSEYELGNLSEQTLEEVWNGPRIKGLRKMLMENRKPSQCLCGLSTDNAHREAAAPEQSDLHFRFVD